ncbi:MAG: trypsin-like peptidase domain-containing protein [Akkermansiaceae bacterium]
MLRSLFILPLLVANLLAAPQKTPAELDAHLRELAPSLVDSTIAIFLGGGSGSGVIVTEDGLVITAAHVTSKPGEQVKVLLSDGRELPATSLGADHETDGALLQINAPGPFPFRPYVKTKTYEVGDWAIATGHPGGPVIGRPAPVRIGRIIAAGVGSGFRDAISTDATVISGDSGGPLFNLDGEVIGINSNVGMPWTANQHVPMPAIIAKWDALMASEMIGRASASPGSGQGEEPFDEPFRELRKEFLEALGQRPADDTTAKELRERPALLDPHTMQHYLDQWAPDEEAPTAPFLGLKLDLGETSRALVEDVVSDSPAEQAGLQKGDIIQSLAGKPISSPISFALALKSLESAESISIQTDRGAISLKPRSIPARRHFPMPVAGLISMMVSDSAIKTPPSIREVNRQFLEPLEPLLDGLSHSVMPIYQDRKLLTHATAVSRTQLITKASELEKKEDLVIRFEENDYPFTVVSTDKKRDLALISAKIEGLSPIKLRAPEPEVATLVFTPTKQGFLSGVITQPARSAPAKGFELNVESDQPSGYVGISFTPDDIQPTVQTVELGSPADSSGFLEGDVITHFQGKKVETIEDISKALKNFTPGQKVKFKIQRDTEEMTIPVILDVRPAGTSDKPSRAALQRDQALSSLSARGGKLSKRRNEFPRVLYHDQLLPANHTGTPLVDVEGNIVGINIARSLRQRSLALPMSEIIAFFREELEKDRRTD